MNRIEYRVIEADGREDLQEQLAGYGQAGWRIEHLTTTLSKNLVRPLHTVIVSRALESGASDA